MKIFKNLFLCAFITLIIGCSDDEKDNEPPLIRIEQPGNDFSINKGENITFKIKSNDPDGLIDKVEIALNNDIIYTTSDQVFDYSINSSKMKNGANTITAKAYDNEGSIGEALIQGTVVAVNPSIRTLPVNVTGLFSISGEGYEIIEEGIPSIIKTGICYNKTGIPTVEDTVLDETNFSSQSDSKYEINDLQMGTDYFIRSFADNGDVVVYGNEIKLTTSKDFYSDLGTFVDERDGTQYKWVKIGNQTWMAENLKYKGTDCSSNENKDELLESIYGRFYHSINQMKCCPDGWEFPSISDWNSLISYLGGEEIAGKFLKDTRLWESSSNINNLNSTKFSALPAGFFFEEFDSYPYFFYEQFGSHAYFFVRDIDPTTSIVMQYNNDIISYGSAPTCCSVYPYISVRCIKSL